MLSHMKKRLLSRWIPLVLVFACLLHTGCSREDEPRGLRLGDPAPDFAAKGIDDKVVVLSSLRGGPVILRFFETNCRFCKADTPVFKEFYRKYQERGLQVIYIGSFYEKRDTLQKFVKEMQLDFPVVMDTEAKLADLYDIRAYPQTLFIGPDQKILAALLGGVGRAEMQEILGKYLEEKPSARKSALEERK